jgi:hypothetical protein
MPFLKSAETYDPTSGAQGAWATTGALANDRSRVTATRLRDGRVLVSGGYTWWAPHAKLAIPWCELYDAAAGAWTPTGSLATARYGHATVVLRDGRVLTCGGADAADVPLASTELYTP